MKIERIAKSLILKRLSPGKVLVLLGARRTGKTFLLKEIIAESSDKITFWNGEDFAVHELLKFRSARNYKNILGDTSLLIIDEAQYIPEAERILKLMVDSFDNLKILVTGSSSFDIANLTGEPLTGRKTEIRIFPISEFEFSRYEKPENRLSNLEHRLVFGSMPELVNLNGTNEKEEYLKTLVSSYLFRDILSLENIRNSSKIFGLVKLIAFQTGNEVSHEELARQLGLSRVTVEKYLDILCKMFILYRFQGYSRNLRKEIVKSSKYYFADNGIRNAVIADFKPLVLRGDTGQLWENHMISERIKFQNYSGMIVNNYFWRTYDKQEIDLVEEREGNLFAYEMKWSGDRAVPPAAFSKAYPEAEYKVINRNNYFEWISLDKPNIPI